MCEYCEWQQNGEEEEPIQANGLTMLIYNSNILGVFGSSSDNVLSYSEIDFCPKCGRELS